MNWVAEPYKLPGHYEAEGWVVYDRETRNWDEAAYFDGDAAIDAIVEAERRNLQDWDGLIEPNP